MFGYKIIKEPNLQRLEFDSAAYQDVLNDMQYARPRIRWHNLFQRLALILFILVCGFYLFKSTKELING